MENTFNFQGENKHVLQLTMTTTNGPSLTTIKRIKA